MENLNSKGTEPEIKHHMARAFFLSAYASAYEEAPDSSAAKRKIGSVCGRNWDDIAPKENDKAAIYATNELAENLLTANGVKDLETLYQKAIDAKQFLQGDRQLSPENFGHYLAMQAMGHGVGLESFGDSVRDAIKVPYLEFSDCDLEKDYF